MTYVVELAKKSFQRQMAYRAANIAGLLTNLFFGMLRASVMVAVFAYRDNVGGYDLARAITFTGTFPSIEEIESFKPWNK